MSKSDMKSWLATVKKGQFLKEVYLKALCSKVRELLIEEANIQPVKAPVTIAGDLHGQFYDLMNLFKVGGDVPLTSYIFMGDFVDRGHHSVETIELLLALKANFPYAITLLRGNHECRQITRTYGFYTECYSKYGSTNVWKHCTEIFDYFPLAGLINGRVLCVHGGLSPDICTLDQIVRLERYQEIPRLGPFCDLMWSDPSNFPEGTWMPSDRGAGWWFGWRVTKSFNHINRLELICRAHQLVEEGHEYMFDDKDLVTVWSAPNYCYRCGNKASIMAFDENLDRIVRDFREVEDHGSRQQSSMPQYFF